MSHHFRKPATPSPQPSTPPFTRKMAPAAIQAMGCAANRTIANAIARLLIPGVLLSLVAPAPGRAQPGGLMTALLSPNARIASMGNTGLLASDGDAVLSNPSMLTAGRGSSLSYHRLNSQTEYASFGIVQTVSSYTVGFGVQHLESGSVGSPYSVAERTTSGDAAGDSRNSRKATGTGFVIGASRMWKGFRVGAATRYSSDQTRTEQNGKFTLDAGASRQLRGGTLTFAARNLGSAIRVRQEGNGTGGGATTGSDDREIELAHSVGAAWGIATRPVSEWFDAGFQAQVTAEGSDWFVRPAAGGEIAYVPIQGVSVAARAGVRGVRKNPESPVTLGFGFNYDSYSFDYSFEPATGKGGSVHRIGLRVR